MSTPKGGAGAALSDQRDATAEVRVTPQLPASPPDKYHGQGGSYLRDPDTGERVLIERTGPCDCAG